MRKFAGREHVLCAKLRKKYGVAPDLSGAASYDRVASGTPSTVATAATAVAPAPPHQQQPPARPSHPYDPNFVAFTAPPSSDSPLDYRSSAFDPLRALRQRERLPHLTPTQPLDNIAKCRNLVRPAALFSHRLSLARSLDWQTDELLRTRSSQCPIRTTRSPQFSSRARRQRPATLLVSRSPHQRVLTQRRRSLTASQVRPASLRLCLLVTQY